MTELLVELNWPDASESVNLTELAQACTLDANELSELVEYGALLPLQQQPEPRFSVHCIAPLRTAARLLRDFDLDLFSVSMLLEYLNRIEALEQQVRTLQARQ